MPSFAQSQPCPDGCTKDTLRHFLASARNESPQSSNLAYIPDQSLFLFSNDSSAKRGSRANKGLTRRNKCKPNGGLAFLNGEIGGLDPHLPSKKMIVCYGCYGCTGSLVLFFSASCIRKEYQMSQKPVTSNKPVTSQSSPRPRNLIPTRPFIKFPLVSRIVLLG